jgi:hypothetical protein
MDNFIFYQTLMLKPMLQSIDYHCPDYKYNILQNYLTHVYIDQDVPSIWIKELCKKIKFSWRMPTDDYSSESAGDD